MNSDLKKSFIILKRISNELINAEEGIKYLVQKKMDVFNGSQDATEVFHINTCMYGLIYFSFIRYDSFLDEYHKFFNSPDENTRLKLKGIKRQCKKYIQNVNEIFGSIKEARNALLAHGYRNEQNALDNKTINEIYNRLLIHDTLDPFIQLSNTPNLIVTEIEKEFGALSEEEIALM